MAKWAYQLSVVLLGVYFLVYYRVNSHAAAMLSHAKMRNSAGWVLELRYCLIGVLTVLYWTVGILLFALAIRWFYRLFSRRDVQKPPEAPSRRYGVWGLVIWLVFLVDFFVLGGKNLPGRPHIPTPEERARHSMPEPEKQPDWRVDEDGLDTWQEKKHQEEQTEKTPSDPVSSAPDKGQ